MRQLPRSIDNPRRKRSWQQAFVHLLFSHMSHNFLLRTNSISSPIQLTPASSPHPPNRPITSRYPPSSISLPFNSLVRHDVSGFSGTKTDGLVRLECIYRMLEKNPYRIIQISFLRTFDRVYQISSPYLSPGALLVRNFKRKARRNVSTGVK